MTWWHRRRSSSRSVCRTVANFRREEMLAMGEKKCLVFMSVVIHCRNMKQNGGKNITKTTGDFVLDEESGTARGITDDEKAMIGGIITAKNVKYTKTEQSDGISDGRGSVQEVSEVIVFPREYERYHLLMQEEQKVFIRGRNCLRKRIKTAN